MSRGNESVMRKRGAMLLKKRRRSNEKQMKKSGRGYARKVQSMTRK